MADERLVVGCMTGTSIDGLDVALVRVRGRGQEMTAELVRASAHSLRDLGPRLRALAEQRPATSGEIAALSWEFSRAHGAAVRELLDAAGENAPHLVCVHGQTVFHRPPLSWQLFNPWPVVEAVGAPVVFDLRGADLARGGQGAPITPLADWVLLRSGVETRAVVNLGGFCNVTMLPGGGGGGGIEGVTGFDACPCNLLLDEVARIVLRVPFDDGGAAALSGRVLDEPLEDLLGVLASVSRAGRSLGSGDEAAEWVSRWRLRCKGPDLAATACGAIAETIASRVGSAERVLIAGGGAKNAALVRALGSRIAGSGVVGRGVVQPTDSYGVPGEWREAMEFGVLGALCADGVSITLPGVTGRRTGELLSGCWAGIGKIAY